KIDRVSDQVKGRTSQLVSDLEGLDARWNAIAPLKGNVDDICLLDLAPAVFPAQSGVEQQIHTPEAFAALWWSPHHREPRARQQRLDDVVSLLGIHFDLIKCRKRKRLWRHDVVGIFPLVFGEMANHG